MSYSEYLKAAKLGDREYKHCVSKGWYPYLPVLDDIISHVEIEAQVPLGLVQIPLKSVVGTYSAGRTTAFAGNFMPILYVDSEFARKWTQLHESMEKEGKQDRHQPFLTCSLLIIGRFRFFVFIIMAALVKLPHNMHRA